MDIRSLLNNNDAGPSSSRDSSRRESETTAATIELRQQQQQQQQQHMSGDPCNSAWPENDSKNGQCNLRPIRSNEPERMTIKHHRQDSFMSGSPTTTDFPRRLVDDDAEHAPKSLPCYQCSKLFTRRSDLVRHERIHSGVRPHSCLFPLCGKSFIQRSALTIHERVHNGDKPHECQQCAKRFSDSSSLARHRRTHTGVRPYRCDFPGCGKDFTRKTTLSRHRQQHTAKGHVPVSTSSGSARSASKPLSSTTASSYGTDEHDTMSSVSHPSPQLPQKAGSTTACYINFQVKQPEGLSAPMHLHPHHLPRPMEMDVSNSQGQHTHHARGTVSPAESTHIPADYFSRARPAPRNPSSSYAGSPLPPILSVWGGEERSSTMQYAPITPDFGCRERERRDSATATRHYWAVALEGR